VGVGKGAFGAACGATGCGNLRKDLRGGCTENEKGKEDANGRARAVCLEEFRGDKRSTAGKKKSGEQ